MYDVSDTHRSFDPNRLSPMSLLPAAIVILIIAMIGGALALSAFFWALRTRQFSIKQINEGAKVIFDAADDIGMPSDQLFKKQKSQSDE